MSRAKVNPFLQILVYSTSHPKFKTVFEFQTSFARISPDGTSEIIPFGANSDLHRNCTLCRNFSAGTSELLLFGANSNLPWEWKYPEITSWGFLFAFSGTSELIPFDTGSDLCWNCLAGTLELIPFGVYLDLLWYLRFPEIPSLGLLLVSPPLRFTLIIRSCGTTYFPVGDSNTVR